ncbi:hypothetical protein CBM2605_B100356 [Cupriavidus neocaledonicus]|uniref:Uncharacterized protein n=1 Tax=Cupriavidus neocaledonicus TaxID=1040979 RepID=A0ABY1V7G7_9BURK|nr:hypothetical protein CBM2605_B100356 [Cupriavidus neocaledonicus]
MRAPYGLLRCGGFCNGRNAGTGAAVRKLVSRGGAQQERDYGKSDGGSRLHCASHC